MKKHLWTIIKFSLFLGFGILLLWLVIRNFSAAQRQEIIDSMFRANYGWILLSILFGILSHLSRAMRWRMLIKPLGKVPRISVTFCAVMVGYLANLAFPRLGEVTKCGIINKYERVPVDKLVGTMLIERSVDLISLILVTVLTLVLQFKLINEFFTEKVVQPLTAKVSEGLQGILLTLAIVLAVAVFLYFLMKKLRNTAFYQRVKTLLRNIREGLLTIRELDNIPVFIFHSFFIWFMYLSMVWIAFDALPETSHLGLSAALAVLVFGSVGILATPGGIGAYQLIVKETLIRLYLLSEAMSFAFANLIWASQTILILLIGFAALLILPLLTEKKIEYEAS